MSFMDKIIISALVDDVELNNENGEVVLRVKTEHPEQLMKLMKQKLIEMGLMKG